MALPPAVFAIALLTIISPLSPPGVAAPVDIVTLVPASSDALILDAKMIDVCPAVKVAAYDVPESPEAAIVML